MQAVSPDQNAVPPINLAVTISGAVSLGSFEAGALYELLSTLEQYNKSNVPKIKIDVFSGASAGGMTAAIAAQHMLYDRQSFKDAENNPLYKAWVEDVDLADLLKMQQRDQGNLSIFSSCKIEQIAKKYLGGSFDDLNIDSTHPVAADSIQVGLALSNLSGVDFGVNIWGGDISQQDHIAQKMHNISAVVKGETPEQPSSKFIYTKYADQQIYDFKKQTFDKHKWHEFTKFVVSCGAFPGAFRPVEIPVKDGHYHNDSPTPDQTKNYIFTDGGVFQNEPIGLAKNIVDKIDEEHLHNDRRFYCYIAPGLKGSSIDSHPLELKDMNAVGIARTVAKAIFNQSRFHDWITAEQTNNQLARLDKTAVEFRNLLLENKKSPNSELNKDSILKVVDPLLTLFFKSQTEIDGQLARLEKQYAFEILEFGNDTELKRAWLKSVLVLESSAGLGAKDEMRIFGITADEGELAGSKLFAFTGFFDRKFREHDYKVGQKKAREVMLNIEQLKAYVSNSDLKIDSSILNNCDVMGDKASPEARQKLLQTYDRAVTYFLYSLLDNWLSIKRLAFTIAKLGSRTVLLVILAATLAIFALGTLFGLCLTQHLR